MRTACKHMQAARKCVHAPRKRGVKFIARVDMPPFVRCRPNGAFGKMPLRISRQRIE